MKIIIDMEIESDDYGGMEFKEEIEKLIKDIDSDSRLLRFKMRQKLGFTDAGKDIDWTLWEDD